MRLFNDQLLADLFIHLQSNYELGNYLSYLRRILNISNLQNDLGIKLPQTYLKNKFIIYIDEPNEVPSILFELHEQRTSYNLGWFLIYPDKTIIGSNIFYKATRWPSARAEKILERIGYPT